MEFALADIFTISHARSRLTPEREKTRVGDAGFLVW